RDARQALERCARSRGARDPHGLHRTTLSASVSRRRPDLRPGSRRVLAEGLPDRDGRVPESSLLVLVCAAELAALAALLATDAFGALACRRARRAGRSLLVRAAAADPAGAGECSLLHLLPEYRWPPAVSLRQPSAGLRAL